MCTKYSSIHLIASVWSQVNPFPAFLQPDIPSGWPAIVHLEFPWHACTTGSDGMTHHTTLFSTVQLQINSSDMHNLKKKIFPVGQRASPCVAQETFFSLPGDACTKTYAIH